MGYARISGKNKSINQSNSKFAWGLQWLLDDNPRHLLSLRKRAMRKAQQSWHCMWQASAKSLAPSTSIEAPTSTYVLALY
jgi:hypothetical protein